MRGERPQGQAGQEAHRSRALVQAPSAAGEGPESVQRQREAASEMQALGQVGQSVRGLLLPLDSPPIPPQRASKELPTSHGVASFFFLKIKHLISYLK